MIITLTMNPAIDKTAYIDEFKIKALNRLGVPHISIGGKGINVSKTIASLKGTSIACGFVGGSSGKEIISKLKALGIENHMIEVKGNTRTNLKIINKEKELTELNEDGPYISNEDLIKLEAIIFSLGKEKDILVLSGSVPKNVDKEVYYQLILKCKKRGITTILDADGELFADGIKANPDIIKPNRYELCKYLKLDESCSEEELILKGKQLITNKSNLLVISMGKEGAIFIDENQVVKGKGLKVKAGSSVGAGDAMVGALAYAKENQYSFIDMVKLCMATSAGAVTSIGTQPANIKEVEQLMKQVEIEVIESRENNG